MIDTGLTESEKAFFTSGQTRIPVDFNPVTLQLTVQNQVSADGKSAVQHVSSSSAKLDLELIFDSTGTGEDVRQRTSLVEKLMAPKADNTVEKVRFEWGAFVFEGVVDSFKQTFEFFSRNGVPLRAVIALSISQPKYTFEPGNLTRTASVNDTLDVAGGSPSSLAAAGGDPSAARQIASDNQLESLRASASGSLSVRGGISIGAAAGFAAGAGASAGLGLSAGGGAGLGGGLGVSLGGGAQAGISPGGAAGVSSSAGAGLTTGSPAGNISELRSGNLAASGKNFRAAALLPAATIANRAAGKFGVDGKVSLAAAGSFKADVSGGVRFDS
jgi:hypothetical protein